MAWGKNRLKYEVAQELGIGGTEMDYKEYLKRAKMEAANELGIQLDDYNPNITAREAGQIGGRVGGKIGGNMVRKMIEYAEQNMQ